MNIIEAGGLYLGSLAGLEATKTRHAPVFDERLQANIDARLDRARDHRQIREQNRRLRNQQQASSSVQVYPAPKTSQPALRPTLPPLQYRSVR